jgi:hypothetical protein
MENIIITDEEVIQFYNENPHIDANVINKVFIDILKSLSSNLTNTLTNTINSQILSIVTDIHSNINLIKTDIILKLHDSKKEYIESIKLIIDNNSLTNNEKINSVLEKSHDSLLLKTTSIINDVIPKSQDKCYSQIETCIKSFCNTISQDTAKLLEQTHPNNTPVSNVVTTIEQNFTKMISSIQQPIVNFIQSSEERTSTNMQRIKEQLVTYQSQQSSLTSELNEFLNKYKHNSSTKGNVSETELYYVLQSILPEDEIIKVSGITASCDYKVNRMDSTKPSILFENKDYTRSVTTEEVSKFERDLQIQQSHGIFISHNSPITFKPNFHIDVIKGLIHIYIPNADYDSHKIKMAIDIIDNLSMKLSQIAQQNNIEEICICKEDLDDIVSEYHNFVSQKIQMIESIKLITKQLVDKLEELQLPKLKKLFVKYGAIETDDKFKCTICNNWSGKNKASLGAHIRNCKAMSSKISSTPTIDNVDICEEIAETNSLTNKKTKSSGKGREKTTK